MTGSTVATFDDDDEDGPVADESKEARLARLARHDRRMRRAYKDGGLDVLEQFVPGILAAMQRSQELLPKVFELVEECIADKNTTALKDVAPLVKMLLDENKRLLDRRFGTSVQRTQNDTTVKVQHVSLRGLIAQRAEANQKPDDDEHVVDAEVIRE